VPTITKPTETNNKVIAIVKKGKGVNPNLDNKLSTEEINQGINQALTQVFKKIRAPLKMQDRIITHNPYLAVNKIPIRTTLR
jgi:3-hydroxy-3-methylglutaryl CoA synthase